MGEDVVSLAAKLAGLKESKSQTETFSFDFDPPDTVDREMENQSEKIHMDLGFTARDVIFATRYEMARKVEDFLARRERSLLMDARASQAVAPKVAKIMAEELNKDDQWVRSEIKDYTDLVKNYILE